MQGSTAELDFMLKDAGVPVVFGGVTVYGLLDVSPVYTQAEGGIQMVGRITKLGIRDGSLAGLVQESIVAVTGVSYRVVDLGDPDADGLRWVHLAPSAVPATASGFAFDGQVLQ